MSTVVVQSMPAASSRRWVGSLKMQFEQKASGSGRRRHAVPPVAPTQTSGSSTSVSPPSPNPGSVVTITSQAPRANMPSSARVGAEIRRTCTRGSSAASFFSTRGIAG